MAAVACWGSQVFSKASLSRHAVWHGRWKTDDARRRGRSIRPAALFFASLFAGLKRASRVSSRRLAACNSAAGDVGFAVKAIDGKGLGALATVPIRRGDRVLQEAPLLCMDSNQTSALDDPTSWQALNDVLGKTEWHHCEATRRQDFGDSEMLSQRERRRPPESSAPMRCLAKGRRCSFRKRRGSTTAAGPMLFTPGRAEDGLMVLHATRAIQPGGGALHFLRAWILVTRAEAGTAHEEVGVGDIRGTLFWGPYNKDPTI